MLGDLGIYLLGCTLQPLISRQDWFARAVSSQVREAVSIVAVLDHAMQALQAKLPFNSEFGRPQQLGCLT